MRQDDANHLTSLDFPPLGTFSARHEIDNPISIITAILPLNGVFLLDLITLRNFTNHDGTSPCNLQHSTAPGYLFCQLPICHPSPDPHRQCWVDLIAHLENPPHLQPSSSLPEFQVPPHPRQRLDPLWGCKGHVMSVGCDMSETKQNTSRITSSTSPSSSSSLEAPPHCHQAGHYGQWLQLPALHFPEG